MLTGGCCNKPLERVIISYMRRYYTHSPDLVAKLVFPVCYHHCREMFSHINKKGMEVILHFLFSKLDSHVAYEEFRYTNTHDPA